MKLLFIAPLTTALVLSACSIDQSSQREKESGIKDALPKATSSKAEPTQHKAIIPDWLLEPYTKKVILQLLIRLRTGCLIYKDTG